MVLVDQIDAERQLNTNKFTEDFPEEMINNMLSNRQTLKEHVLQHARRGDLQNVVDTIDQFCWTTHWMMNIGDRKGKILDQAIQQRQPKTVLELGKVTPFSPFIRLSRLFYSTLGTFLGYSSLRMVLHLPAQSHIYSIEADQESAEIAQALHQFAGVNDRITVINQYTDTAIPQLKEKCQLETFDLIFIDHYKDAYLRDLRLLEQYGLIGKGTMVVADNVITPGAPDYLAYVRNNPNYTTTFYEGTIEYREDLPDGIEISIRQ